VTAAGARLARSAGNSAEVVAHDAGYTQIKLPSSEVRRVSDLCYASVGTVGNEEQRLVNIGKAGRSRWLGKRPTVRGTAMNPVDHPMGGGEGKASGGQPRSRSGQYSRGLKTRTKGKGSDKHIIQRKDGSKLSK
jgi:large subunit ribosomal protein L2